mmetsp:Transcript_23704/g.41329  ORF Transcript_23704/g.41329 Transcript_23704/m.41329 type:complete len:422 (+) Transcript_23704:19-1284(+)
MKRLLPPGMLCMAAAVALTLLLLDPSTPVAAFTISVPVKVRVSAKKLNFALDDPPDSDENPAGNDEETEKLTAARIRSDRRYANMEIFRRMEVSGPVDVLEFASNAELPSSNAGKEGYLSSLLNDWNSWSYRFIVFGCYFVVFPLIELPLGYLQTVDNAAVLRSLTSSFLPSISLLFATLSSFTISALIEINTKIRESANEELCCAVQMAQKVAATKLDGEVKRSLLCQIFLYLYVFASCSRQQELNLMLYDDPLLRIMQILSDQAESPKNEGALAAVGNVYSLRQRRLSVEGETVPSAQLSLLQFLGGCIALGFVVLCDTSGISGDMVAMLQSQFFFALLLSCLTVGYRFVEDLQSPFSGCFTVAPRSLTSVKFAQVRNLIMEADSSTTMLAYSKFIVTKLRSMERDMKRNKGKYDDTRN